MTSFLQDPDGDEVHDQEQSGADHGAHVDHPDHSSHGSSQPQSFKQFLSKNNRALIGALVAVVVSLTLVASIWSVGKSQDVRQQASEVIKTKDQQPELAANPAPLTIEQWMEKIKNRQMLPPAYPPDVPPPVPPMDPNAIVQKVLVIAYGENQEVIPPEFPNQNEYILTNEEYIPFLEHSLEWASVAGNYNSSPSGQLARVNIQFPYQFVQLPLASAPVIVNPPQDEYDVIVDAPIVDPAVTNFPDGQSICQLVNANLIDEVWILGGNGTNFANAIMAGPDYGNTIAPFKAFPTGWEPVTTSTCTKGVHIMGLPYNLTYEVRFDQYPPVFPVLERAPSVYKALHAFSKRFEHTYAYFLDNNPRYYYPNGVGNPGWPDPDGLYDAFQFDRTHGYQPMSPPPTLPAPPRSCGNADYVPNLTNREVGKYWYKYSAAYPGYRVKSDCTNNPSDWNPQHTFVPATDNVDCSLWGCWQSTYHMWWMQHFPNVNNTYCRADGVTSMPDWWYFNYRNDIRLGNNGVCSVPNPTPTPTPSPSPVPSPTPFPAPTLFNNGSACNPTRTMMSWTNVVGATQYEIRRCTGACTVTESTPVHATVNQPTLTFTDTTNVLPSTVYKYKVKGIAAGNSGTLSNTASFTTFSCVPSPVPTPTPPPGVACGGGCVEQTGEVCQVGLVCDRSRTTPPFGVAGICVIPACNEQTCTCTAP